MVSEVGNRLMTGAPGGTKPTITGSQSPLFAMVLSCPQRLTFHKLWKLWDNKIVYQFTTYQICNSTGLQYLYLPKSTDWPLFVVPVGHCHTHELPLVIPKRMKRGVTSSSVKVPSPFVSYLPWYDTSAEWPRISQRTLFFLFEFSKISNVKSELKWTKMGMYNHVVWKCLVFAILPANLHLGESIQNAQMTFIQ